MNRGCTRGALQVVLDPLRARQEAIVPNQALTTLETEHMMRAGWPVLVAGRSVRETSAETCSRWERAGAYGKCRMKES